ncbi:hypothetical protein A3709_18785 [Halioglobus sp. HI00S01]|uniref:hypothetical protein n=1 Tax=Halioglobus sp. HI00S01 TaxID=1822214 RepID=UPI0007C27BB5|nr:hypothetical protein [Halioglobus sp. HI00S01]KZX57671.1 hypothetical protein A3709_18785 [Halioglobus sp. HI00S01]
MASDRADKAKKWTEETIRSFVTTHDISTRTELFHRSQAAYYAANEFEGLMLDLFGPIRAETKWSAERIREYVEENEIMSRTALAGSAPGAYKALKRYPKLAQDLFGGAWQTR